MEIFTKYNRKDNQDRQIDTLIGLCKGITADGKVDQAEAEFLQTWLVQNNQSQNPIIVNLLSKVGEMLEDGVLDQEESGELLSVLYSISGEKSELGEVSKTSTLPICSPAPKIEFDDRTFLFTGTCAYGTRKDCQSAIESLGGTNAKSVTKGLNYLVLGTYVTDSWAHESFGRKIEKAMEYRESGLPITIITEEHWLNESGF
ncbi:MAG: BRCT domain-containing protein [Paraglaciecola sp.]|uniref:BRCT domain-containing protein n=1 Tax=Paraglaciecola sp. TaxID=1920173 RepID=UPI003299B9EE